MIGLKHQQHNVYLTVKFMETNPTKNIALRSEII